jgi:hypothetical protein
MPASLDHYLELRADLQQELEEIEREIAVVDHAIARRRGTRAAGGASEPKQKPPQSQAKNGEGARGRPATVIWAVRKAARGSGKTFDLYSVLETLEKQTPGHGFTRKAVSSALGRLARKHELHVAQAPVNGRSATVYEIGEKFPRNLP